MAIPAPAGVAASGLPPAGDQANAVLQGVIGAVGPTQPFAFRGPMNLFLWASINTALTTVAASLAATVASGTGLSAGVAVNSTLVPKGAIFGSIAGTNATLALPPISQTGLVNTQEAVVRNLPRTAGLVGSTVSGFGIPAATTVLAIITPAVPATNDSPGVLGVVQISKMPTVAPVNNNEPEFYTFTGVAGEILAAGVDANATFTGAAISYVGNVQLERSFDGGATWLVCNIGAGTLAQFTAGTPVSITFGEPEKQMLYRLNCIAYTSGVINYRISQTGGAAESLAIGPLTSG